MMNTYYIFETVNNVEKSDFDWLGVLGLVVQMGLLVLAWRALNIWKKQLRGTDEYKIALELFVKIGQIKKEIKKVRDPINIYSLQIKQIKYSEKISIFQLEKDVYKKRLNNFGDFLVNEYDGIRSRAEIILIDKNLKNLLKKLDDKIFEIVRSYEKNYNNKYDTKNKDMNNSRLKNIEKNKKILFKQSTDDKFYEKFIKITNNIETLLKESYINDKSIFQKIKDFLFKNKNL